MTRQAPARRRATGAPPKRAGQSRGLPWLGPWPLGTRRPPLLRRAPVRAWPPRCGHQLSLLTWCLKCAERCCRRRPGRGERGRGGPVPGQPPTRRSSKPPVRRPQRLARATSFAVPTASGAQATQTGREAAARAAAAATARRARTTRPHGRQSFTQPDTCKRPEAEPAEAGSAGGSARSGLRRASEDPGGFVASRRPTLRPWPPRRPRLPCPRRCGRSGPRPRGRRTRRPRPSSPRWHL